MQIKPLAGNQLLAVPAPIKILEVQDTISTSVPTELTVMSLDHKVCSQSRKQTFTEIVPTHIIGQKFALYMDWVRLNYYAFKLTIRTHRESIIQCGRADIDSEYKLTAHFEHNSGYKIISGLITFTASKDRKIIIDFITNPRTDLGLAATFYTDRIDDLELPLLKIMNTKTGQSALLKVDLKRITCSSEMPTKTLTMFLPVTQGAKRK